ncbi:MAG: hypothetical protein IV100_03350 [Myxococcales bacterium]|nr:hypothetical protein [Myxococcales bacterium]
MMTTPFSRAALLAAVALGCDATSDVTTAAVDVHAEETAVVTDEVDPDSMDEGDVATIGDVATTFVVPRPVGYTATFRQTLANKAPASHDEGERIFFEETWGAEASSNFPPADFLIGLWKGDPARWGVQFSRYGFLTDPNDDLPIGLKRGSVDPSRAKDTCSACHTTRLPDGRLWAGMPATQLDLDRFTVDVDDAWVAAGNPSNLTEPGQRERLLSSQPGSLNVDGDGKTINVFNDFPLYSGLHRMSHMNILGTGLDLRTEVWLSVFGFVSPLPFPEAHATLLVDYFGTLDEPEAPVPVDGASVERGRVAFEKASCSSCHHDDIAENDVVTWREGDELLPGQDPDFDNGTIATSGLFLKSATGQLDTGGGLGPGLDKLLEFIVLNGLKVENTEGYVASNLHALWASAPYLHNGSVPTLEALLTPPAERPKTFTRSVPMPDGDSPAAREVIVDTSAPGLDNGGHAFGTTLSADEKVDLIAYLRSL